MSDTILNFVFCFQVLIVGAACLSRLIRTFGKNKWVALSARQELSMNYSMLLFVAILPIAVNLFGQEFNIQPITKSYIASTYREYETAVQTGESPKILLSEEKNSPSISIASIKNGVLTILLLAMFISALNVLRDFRSLRKILSSVHVFRKIGKVRVGFSENISIPFSVLLGKAAWVIVPNSFLADSRKMAISILHELQHHRQRDTMWLLVIQVFKAATAFNPFFGWWSNTILELQELKVDENLVDHGKVNPREYARCLIEVAETAVLEERRPTCAAGFAFLPDRLQLTRRIEAMFNKKICSKESVILIGGFLLVSMTALAVSTGKFLGTRAISMKDAQAMAEVAQRSTRFPVVVNDLVLEQLNRYLGTAQGRTYMKNALLRMEKYRPLIEEKIKQYDMPLELLAVPIIESGYRNLPESRNSVRSAGLWQFIRSTAKVYGLRVDNVVDERLDVDLSTDAALRYILSNQLRFQDWLLAMQAYNVGEVNLQKAIVSQGSRNVWDLIRAGFEGDKGYIAKIEAAVLIMKNPESLE
jgi:membrane-bound lytic murein transglycosylase D